MKLLMRDQKITWKSITFNVVLMILASDFDFPSSNLFGWSVESSVRTGEFGEASSVGNGQ